MAPTPLRAAFEAQDLDGIVAALAPDVTLRSPIFEEPIVGIDQAARPVRRAGRGAPVAAFLSETGPKLGRHRAGAGAAALVAATGSPFAAMMRATASLGPRLLRVGRGR